MPAGQELAALRQLVRLIVIHPSGSGCGDTGVWQLADKVQRVPNAE
jgi:hypothetical protein